jgi:hypothetical protein
MLPDTDFPTPKPSFQYPISLIQQQPGEGDQVCVTFAKAWLPAIRGALQQLLLQSTWDTTDEEALTAMLGRVFNLIYLFDEDAECAMPFDVRIDPTNSCMLQKSTDGGETWDDVGSFYTCAYGAGQDAIQDAIEDGTLGGGSQPGPSAPPAPNECHNYHVTLKANDRWVCPFPVSSGYTVRVTNARGACWDGDTFLGRWYCPDGKVFFLGACAGDVPYYEADPYQDGNHMQIVANAADEWGDPLTGVWNIPAGVASQNLYIQVNDESLQDNQGTYDFDIEICTTGWCYYWDFTTSDGGWVAYGGLGSYALGEGWQTVISGGAYVLALQKLLGGSETRKFIQASVLYTCTLGSGEDVQQWWTGDGSWVSISAQSPLQAGEHVANFTLTTDEVQDVMYNPNGAGAGLVTVKAITLWGYGTNPFGSDNCP